MAKFEVFLSENFRDSSAYREEGKIWNKVKAQAAFYEGEYSLAGTVEAGDIEEVFEKTQNCNCPGPWNPEKPCRSLSVGDMVKEVETGKFFIVASFGFDEVGQLLGA